MLAAPPMDEDRPHAPTARKLRRAREAGDVAKSPLASSALVLLAGGAALAFGAPRWLGTWRSFAVRALSGEGNLTEAADVLLAGLAGPLAACVTMGAIAAFLQVGPLWTTKPLTPDLGRLDPVRGFSKMFSPSELAARLAPAGLSVALALIALAVLSDSTGLFGRTELAPERALSMVGVVVGEFYWQACALIALAGAVALVYRCYRYWQDQHMSRREVRREQRETEGQPAARRRRRQRHRELLTDPTLAEALRRSVLVVRGADVAVLVAWHDTQRSPTIAYVARGRLAAAAAAALPQTLDDGLARELAGLAVGAHAPRGTWRRLAEHIARPA